MSGVGRLDLIHQFSYVENKKRTKAKTQNKHLSGVSDHVWSEVAFLANLSRPETEQCSSACARSFPRECTERYPV